VDVSRRSVVTAGLLGLLGHDALEPGEVSLSATDLLTGRRFEQHADRACPVLTLSAGLALGRLLQSGGAGDLVRVVRFTRDDVVRSSPVCGWHLQEGLSLAGLGDAALRRGDATATNLLLTQVGGPAGLTAFCRELGDERTRLDRDAPDSCGAAPWDPRDTTSVEALAADHATLLFGAVLPLGTRAVLAGLFPSTRLPGDWTFSGSTATARYGTAVSVGTAQRDRRRVLVAAALRSGQPGTVGSARALTGVVTDLLAGLDRRW
jgi:beta-lactamase class A